MASFAFLDAMEKSTKTALGYTRLGFIADTGSCTAMGEIKAELAPCRIEANGKTVDTKRALDAQYLVKRTNDTDRFFSRMEFGPQANLAVSTDLGTFLLTGISADNIEREDGSRITVLSVRLVTQVM